MALRIDAWPHYPTARGTIASGADPANPQGWQDNLTLIQTQMNNHTHPIRIPHTWAIPGDITTTAFVVPFFIPTFATGQTVTLKGVLADLETGTSATVKLARKPWGGAEGDLAAPYAAMVITPTDSEVTGDVVLNARDKLRLVVTATNTAPRNLTVTLVVEYASA